MKGTARRKAPNNKPQPWFNPRVATPRIPTRTEAGRMQQQGTAFAQQQPEVQTRHETLQRNRTKQRFRYSHHIHSCAPGPWAGTVLVHDSESVKGDQPGWSEHLRQVSRTPALIRRSSPDIHVRSRSGPAYWTRWIFSATQHCCTVLFLPVLWGKMQGKPQKLKHCNYFFIHDLSCENFNKTV